MTTQEFRIPTQNMFKLEEAIETMNKRAKRNKLPLVKLEELRLDQEIVKDPTTGFERTIIHHVVRVTGEQVKIAGWCLVAVLELDDESHAIVRNIPGMSDEKELQRFRRAQNHCDHCGINRPRNDVFLIWHDDNREYKQVGRKCLKDFLGHKNPFVLASSAEYLADVMDICEAAENDEWGQGGGRSKYFSLKEYLEWVFLAARTYGWVSRQTAYDTHVSATADDAMNLMCNPHRRIDDPRPGEREKKSVQDALEWIRSQDEEELLNLKSNFLWDVYCVCRRDMLDYKKIGLAAALLTAYNGKDEKTGGKKKASEWQGQEGEKITRTLTCKYITWQRSDYRGGKSRAWIILEDEEGNNYTWGTTRDEVEKDKTYQVTGTIKKLDTYQGKEQTQLKNCKIAPAKTRKNPNLPRLTPSTKGSR